MQGFSGKKKWNFRQGNNPSIDSEWKDDKKNGNFVFRDINGKKIYEVSYDNNVIYGSVNTYKDNGDLSSSYTSKYNGLDKAAHFFNNKKISDFNLTSKIYVGNNSKEYSLPPVGEYLHINPKEEIHPAEMFPGTIWELVSTDFILTSEKAVHNLAEPPMAMLSQININNTDKTQTPSGLRIECEEALEEKYLNLYRAIVYGVAYTDKGRVTYKRRVIKLNANGVVEIPDIRVFFPTLITTGVRYDLECYIQTPFSRSDVSEMGLSFHQLLALTNINSDDYFNHFNWVNIANPYTETEDIVHKLAKTTFTNSERVFLWRRAEDHSGIGPYLYTKEFKEYSNEKLARTGSYVINKNEYDDPYCALDGDDIVYNPDAIHHMIKRQYSAGKMSNKIELYNSNGKIYNEVLLDSDRHISKGRFNNFTPDDWDLTNDTLIYKFNLDKSSLIPREPYVVLEEADFDTIKPNTFDPPASGRGNPARVEGQENMYDNYHRRNIYGIPDKNITVRIHWGHHNDAQARDFFTSHIISNKDTTYFLPYRTFQYYSLLESVYRSQIHNNKTLIKEFAQLNQSLDMLFMLRSINVEVDKEHGYFANDLYPGAKLKYGVNTAFGNLIEADFIDIYPKFFTDNNTIQVLPDNLRPKDTNPESGNLLFDIGVAYNAMNKTGTDVLTNVAPNITIDVFGSASTYENAFVDRTLRVVRVGSLLEDIHGKMGLLYTKQYDNIANIKNDLKNKLNNATNVIKYVPWVYIHISYIANGRKVEMPARKITESPFSVELTELEYTNLINYKGSIIITPMWKDPDIEIDTNPYEVNDNIAIVIDWGYDDNGNRLKTLKNVNVHDLWDVLHNTTDLTLRVPDHSKIGILKLRHLFYNLNTVQPTDPSELSDQMLLNNICNELQNVNKDNYIGNNISSVYDANKRPENFTGENRSSFFMRRNYLFIDEYNRYLANYKYINNNVFMVDIDSILEKSGRTYTIYAVSTKPYIANYHWTKKEWINNRWLNTEMISTVKGLQIDERVANDTNIRKLLNDIAAQLRASNHEDYKYFTSKYAYYKPLGADIAAVINKTVPKSAIDSDNAYNAEAFIFSQNMLNYQVMQDKNVYVENDSKTTWYNISKYLNLYRNKQLTFSSKVIYNPEHQIEHLDPDFFTLDHNVDPNVLFPGVNHSFDLYLDIPIPEDMKNINPYTDNDVLYIKWDKNDSNESAICKINLKERWQFAYDSNLIRPNQKLSVAFPEGIIVEFPDRLKEYLLNNPNRISSVMNKYSGNKANFLKWLKDNVANLYLDYFNVLDDSGSSYLRNIHPIDNSLVGANTWNTFRFITNKTMRLLIDGNSPLEYNYIRPTGFNSSTDREFLVHPIAFNPDKYIEDNGYKVLVLDINYIIPVSKVLAVDIPNTSWTYTETAPPSGNGRLVMNDFITLQPYKDSIKNNLEYDIIKDLNKSCALRYIFDTKKNIFKADHMTYIWDPSRSLLGELNSYYRNIETNTFDYDIDRLKAILKYPNPAINIVDNANTILANVKYEIAEQVHLPDMRPMTYIIEPTDYDQIHAMLDNADNIKDHDLVSFTEPNGTKSRLSDILVALPEAVMYEWYMWTGLLSQTSAPDGYYARNNIDWFNTDKLIYGSNIVEFITEKIRILRNKHGLSTTDKFPRTVDEFIKSRFNIYFISDPIKDPPTYNYLGESNVFATKERIFTRWIHIADNFQRIKDFAVYIATNVTGADFLNTNQTLKIPSINMTNRNPANGYPAQIPMGDLLKDIDGTMKVGTGSNPVMIIELVV